MEESQVFFSGQYRRVGPLTSARCGQLDIIGVYQRNQLIVLGVFMLLAILLALCIYYCNAYYKVQAKLIEANIWNRMAQTIGKGEDWKMKAWWEEENNGGQRREGSRGRADGRNSESKPRTYARDRRPAENLRNSVNPRGNLGAIVSRPEPIEMKELKTEGTCKSHAVAKRRSFQSTNQPLKVFGENPPSPAEREKVSTRPRMPLPGEIDSLYSRPKSDLSSSDFKERFIYDAVEVPELHSRYRAVGANDTMTNDKELGKKKMYGQASVSAGPKENSLRGNLKEEIIADEKLPVTTCGAVPVYTQVQRKAKSQNTPITLS